MRGGKGRIAAFGLVASLLTGAALVWQPAGAAAVVLLGATVAAAAFLDRRLPRIYLATLGVLLVGYAFLGRGFAYLGAPPIFVGEIVLLLGLVTLFMTDRRRVLTRIPLGKLLLAFGAWGALRTVPYVGAYGIDALRDAVVWGYAAFAVVAAALLFRGDLISRVPRLYARVLPYFLVWVPAAVAAIYIAGEDLPAVPGTEVPLLGAKPGDMATHLGGAGAFLLLGLHQAAGRRRGAWYEWLLWAAWLAGFLAAGSKNRGGMLAAAAALGVVLLVRPLSRWGKLLIVAGGLGALLFASNIELRFGGGREVSPQQIVENMASVFGDAGTPGGADYLSDTRRWRLLWWGEVVDYTVFGAHFWGGKGFGINLANDDGFQTTADNALRSPHNGHLTILARAGVPGAVLWLVLQAAFAWKLLRSYLAAQRGGRRRAANVMLWVLAYWAAFTVNATFDVFLEGPQGGIWFWTLFGFGLALLADARGKPVDAQRAPGPAHAYASSTNS